MTTPQPYTHLRVRKHIHAYAHTRTVNAHPRSHSQHTHRGTHACTHVYAHTHTHCDSSNASTATTIAAMSRTASGESNSLNVSADNMAFWQLAKPFYRLARAPSLEMDSASISTGSASRNTALGLLTSQLIRYYGSDLFSSTVNQPDLKKLVEKMNLSARMSLETWQLHVAQNKFNLYNSEVRRVMNSTLASALQTWKQHTANPEAARRRTTKDIGARALLRWLRKKLTQTFVVWQGLKNQVRGSRLYDGLQDRHGARKSSQHAPANSQKKAVLLATSPKVSRAEKIRGVFARIHKSRNTYQPASESAIEVFLSSSSTINCPAGAPLPRTATSFGPAIAKVQPLNNSNRRINQKLGEATKLPSLRSLPTDSVTGKNPGKSVLQGKTQLLLNRIHTAIDLNKLEITSKASDGGGAGRLKQAVKAVIIANRLFGITLVKCPVATVEISAPSASSRVASLSAGTEDAYSTTENIKISSYGSALLPNITASHTPMPKWQHPSRPQPCAVLHSSASQCQSRLYSHFF